MAITQAQLDALENALATGELSVEYDGRKITYRSISEIKAALDYAKTALGQASITSQSRIARTRD